MSNVNPVAANFKTDLNHSQLQATIVDMAKEWNSMLSVIITGNAICTQMFNKFAENITEEMNTQFQKDIKALKNDAQYSPDMAGKWKDPSNHKKGKWTLEEIQKNIGVLEAQMNEMQSVTQSNTQAVTGISDDTSNKVKEDTDSGHTLIGQTAPIIDTTVYQAAVQAANGISA